MFRAISITRSLVAAGALVVSLGGQAQAIDQLKMMIPAAPGGGWDQTSRTMQQVMTQAGIIKTMQLTNVGGAGGTIGLAQFVNNAKGDGSALMTTGLVMVGAIITNKSPVNLGQTTPIARLTGEYQVIVVPNASRFKSLADMVAALKANPGAVAFAGGSAGGTDHITAGLIAQAIGVEPTKINYVPFAGGGEAQAAILGNHVAGGISGWGEFEAQIKSKRMRALAISAPARIQGIDVPTLKEQGVDVEIANWRGVVGAPGITDAQKQELIRTVEAMHKSKQWQDVLEKNNWTDLLLTGDQFAQYIAAEQTRTQAVLKSIGLAN